MKNRKKTNKPVVFLRAVLPSVNREEENISRAGDDIHVCDFQVARHLLFANIIKSFFRTTVSDSGGPGCPSCRKVI